MLHKPFFDPEKTYEENYEKGPFGAFADDKVFENTSEPTYDFLSHKLHLPFGIAAGPLLNGKYIKAALDKGFDIPVYKTVRTKKYPANQWPNVLSVHIKGDLTFEMAENGVVGDHNYNVDTISITNSFGVPSYDPDIWQPDLASAVKYAKNGQVVVGSFQGTTNASGDVNAYIQDFVIAAKLAKETGTKILEINLSCPNEGAAHLLCFDIERTAAVVKAVKNEVGDTPVIIKIAYYKEPQQLKKLLQEIGNVVDGISSINTIPAKILDKKGEQALPGKGRLYSGTCGHQIKWAGIEQCKRLVKLREELHQEFTIIGVGGVTTPEDYKDYIETGADAVMTATGAMWNPYLAQEIKKSIQ